MIGKKISELDSIVNIDGSEQIPLAKGANNFKANVAQLRNLFDATPLYLAAVKGENGGVVTQEFLDALINAVNTSATIYLENVEPSGFKFKVMVVFAGMDAADSGNINFNASDSKAHYKLVVNKATKKVTYEIKEIKTGIKVVEHGTGDTTFALIPNEYHVWGEVSELTITLAAPTDSTIINEYMFQFTSGTQPTKLTYPQEVKWVAEPKIEASKTYQVSIVNGIGVLGGV